MVAEGAYSQFELDFHYTNLLEMADRLVFFARAVERGRKRTWDVYYLHAKTHHRGLEIRRPY